MPIALLAALAGSLVIHAAALFGADIELPGFDTPPPPLQAELKPLPPLPASTAAPVAKKRAQPAKAASVQPKASASPTEPEARAEETDEAEPMPVVEAAPQTPLPAVPANGVIRYGVFKGEQGFRIGDAEEQWQFEPDGSYRLRSVSETSGLAALLKPLRYETISTGRLAVGGLQPEHYRVIRNGKESNEKADFDWAAGSVHLTRDGSTQPVAPGTQDILSLNFQLAFLADAAEGMSIGVVTGKKYERFAIEVLGEESIDTPAGKFRTLRLRARTSSTTEIWIALDRYRLPVKIRFTDKRGDSYEQVATEIGATDIPAAPAQSGNP